MVHYEKYTFCIRARLFNNGQTENILLIVDTGSPANVLSSRIYNKFENVRDSGFKFSENYIFSPAASVADVKGYSFDRLETDSFAVHNMLFQISRHKNFGCTVDGENVDGFIGMDVLRKCPFTYSVADRKLLFYNTADNTSAGAKFFFDKNAIKKNRLVTEFVLPGGKKIKGCMDTGAQETCLSRSLFTRSGRHLSYNFRAKYKFYSTYESLLDSCTFAGRTIYNIPVYRISGNPFNSGITIGLNILRNFDLYVNCAEGYYRRT